MPKRKNGNDLMSQENNFAATPKQPSRKKNIIIFALATICVILAASIVTILLVYQPTTLQAQMKEKDDTISSLQQQINNLQYQLSTTPNSSAYTQQIAYLQQQLSDLNDTLASTNEYMAYLGNITQLRVSQYLAYQQAVSPGTDAFNNLVYYAGYIVVQATSSSNTTYVQMLYSSNGVDFNQTVTLGTEGTAVFPVLPGTVEIGFANTDQTSEAVTVTIIYYY
jgi:glutathionyl-hydroquinone reductase